MAKTQSEIRKALIAGFEREGVAINAQAITALVHTIYNSSSELVGDTDTLLSGLLFAGSYTIDVLEASGVNIKSLKSLSYSSSRSHISDDRSDAVESLFFKYGASSRAIAEAKEGGRELETADLLRHAITPSSHEIIPHDIAEDILDASSSPQPDSLFQRDLQARVAELLPVLAGYIHPGNGAILRFMRRTHPVSQKEDWLLDRELGRYYKGMTIEELEWIIHALNEWFVYRKILIEPNKLALQVIDRLDDLLFGPSHFAKSGGDLNGVESGLKLAEKLAPERDAPQIGLFLRDNRIFMSPFSYRDTVWTPSRGSLAQDGLAQLNLLTPVPVPLIHPQLIVKFEDIISREHVSELEIQRFLVHNPEFLHALGYSSARPHVCLRSLGAKDLIPDFILDLPGDSGVHILDLKLPSARIAVRNPYLRISAELAKAVAQLRNYSKFFDERDNRRAFEAAYGISAFRPEIIVVMGRSSQFRGAEETSEISEQIKGVKLYTYDDLINYAKTRSILL